MSVQESLLAFTMCMTEVDRTTCSQDLMLIFPAWMLVWFLVAWRQLKLHPCTKCCNT